jgi:hypothetical protein
VVVTGVIMHRWDRAARGARCDLELLVRANAVRVTTAARSLGGRVGEALIAELLRVSDHVPAFFALGDKTEQKLYSDLLMDFAYLKTPALFEHKIE